MAFTIQQRLKGARKMLKRRKTSPGMKKHLRKFIKDHS
jgi:hypothetical protein